MAKTSFYNTRSLYFSNRIIKAMDGMINHPLTIVEAPMGYGKTTTVRNHIEKNGTCVLWQMVYDNSLSGFWKEFSRLFAGLNEDCSQSLLQLGVPNDSVLRQESVRIIEQAGLSVPTLLVIDDYHLVECPEVARFIEYLVLHQITGLHIILITRFISQLSLEELKLKGYLHHIAKETFELLPEEINAYYKLCGIRLNHQEAAELYSLTEGWISALYLFMLEFTATGGYTPENNIHKLVERTIYKPLSEEMKDFLLNVCIFDSFSIELAAHMWCKANTAGILAEIINKNIFIKYDAKTKTYYLHSIFINFLREIFKCQDRSYRHSLYQRAGSWYLQTGDYHAAREYFYQCKDFDSLLSALEEDKSFNSSNANKESLIKYLAECPDEVKSRHHYALLVFALHMFVHNERTLFGKVCEEFNRNLAADQNLNNQLRNRLLGEYELLVSFTGYNDLQKMSAHHQKAWELLGGPTSIYDTQTNWTFGSPSVLYLYYRESGRLQKHTRDIKETQPYYYRLTDGHGNGAEYVMEAERYFNMGEFENSEIAVHKALYAAQSQSEISILLCAQFLQARLALIKGDFSLTSELIRKMRNDLIEKKQYRYLHTVEFCEGSIYSYLGQTEQIPCWIAKGNVNGSRLLFPAYGMFNILFGRVLLQNGEYLKLIGSAEYFIRIASVFPNLLGQIYTYIYLAAANQRIHRDAEALASLQQALAIAMPDKMYLPFVENGDYIEPLLKKVYLDGPYREEIAKVFGLYDSYRNVREKIIKEHFSAEMPKLTGGELEIAQLAAEGLTNKVIAAKLFISENTVKKQLKKVFEKLEIHSRALLKQRMDEVG